MLELEIGHEVVIEEGPKVRFEFRVEYTLELEHSLVTLSKWEEKWEKPFIDGGDKTVDEMLSYIECMIVTPEYPSEVLSRLTQKNVEAVNKYINAKMTATWFNEDPNSPKKTSNEKITAELVYYWLSTLNVDFSTVEHWHLNKLFTFIKIHDVKNRKPRKQSPHSLAAQRREVNRQRREMTGSNG